MLDSKSSVTKAMYTCYIEQFLRCKGNHDYYVQQDIDDYFAGIAHEDRKKDQGTRESKSVQKMRIVALKFYLNQCLGLNLKFRGISTKGRTAIRPHQSFERNTIESLLNVAQNNSAEMYALVRLLYDMAARI